MEQLRTEGNALFAAKQFAEAIDKYTQGLALPVTTESSVEDEQRVLLWSNRAACHLQLEQFDRALADCSCALHAAPSNEKARYRRAQAHVALGNYTEAFQDVRLVLQRNASNKAAIALARKIKEVVQSDVHGVQKALDAITKGICGEDVGKELVALQKPTEEALRYLEMKCVQDLVSMPQEVEAKGGVVVLWRAVNRLLELFADENSSSVSESQRGAIVSLLSHAVGLLGIVASASLPLASTVYQRSNGGASFNALLDVLHRHVEQEYAGAPVASDVASSGALLSLGCCKHIVKLAAFLFKHLMLVSEDDTTIRRALNGMLDGLRSAHVELHVSALDGLLHFISTPNASESTATADEAIKKRKTRFSTLANELGVFALLHATATRALHEMDMDVDATTPPQSQDMHQQQLHDMLLSRLPLVFTQCLAQFEDNETVLKKLVRDHCVAPVLAAQATDRGAVERASASCLLLSALFLSNAKLALWGAQQASNDGTTYLSRLGKFLEASKTAFASDARGRTRRFQEIWVDCVASVCGVEGGTSCVPPALRIEMHKMLRATLEDADLVLRAGALSIQIKMAVVEKVFENESADTAFLIDQVFDVLEKAHVYEGGGNTAKSNKNEDAAQREQQLLRRRMMYWSGASPKERGIESLSYLITQTPVKDAFVKRPRAVESVFQVEFASATLSHSGSHSRAHVPVGYRSNVYYGIGYILHHVLTSESTLKKKKMEGMEMTPDQYEELQKALKQKSVLDDGDTPEKVHTRVKKLVNNPEVLTTLVQLLKYATTQSINVVEMATLSALHAADVADVRGKLVQSGVFQSLLPLSLPLNTGTKQSSNDAHRSPAHKATPISNAAGQAIAKILISTNPHLLPSAALFSSIHPLLELCKGDAQLLQFEALMALTNIASVSDDTKQRIISEPQGLSTLQYLQFSEHELVRRAATEAICNLLPNESVIEKVFLKEDKVRLWLAFASVEEEEEDLATARAAGGALAMVSQVPAVSWLLMQEGGLQAFCRAAVAPATHEETLHRALFALQNMLETLVASQEPEKAEKKQELLTTVKSDTLAGALTARLKAIGTSVQYAPPTKEAAQACLTALQSCVGK